MEKMSPAELLSILLGLWSILLGLWSIHLTKKYKKLSDKYEKWQDHTYENILSRILNIAIDIDDIKKHIPRQGSYIELRKTPVLVSKFRTRAYVLEDQKRIKEKIEKHLSKHCKSIYLESLFDKLILNNKDSKILISLRYWYDDKNKIREFESEMTQLFRSEGLIFSPLI